jgi:hypothetical protein
MKTESMQLDAPQTAATFRYMQLADNLESQIRSGTFRAGEKLPSIRHLHSHTGLSISTGKTRFGRTSPEIRLLCQTASFGYSAGTENT